MEKIVSTPATRFAFFLVICLSTTVAALGSLRSVEPRLSVFTRWQLCRRFLSPDHLVVQAQCPPSHIPSPVLSFSPDECKDMTATRPGALNMIARHPECTDDAVRRLEELSHGPSFRDVATAWSDLAAALYVRAQRNDEPLDLLRALDAADRAVLLAPSLQEARFNQALAQEALGLSVALTSWDELRQSAPAPWSSEIQQHWRRLDRELAEQAGTEGPGGGERIAPLATPD